MQVIAPGSVLEQRVEDPSRGPHGKLLDPLRLREVLRSHDPAPLHPDDLVIHSDLVDPLAAAERIATDLGRV